MLRALASLFLFGVFPQVGGTEIVPRLPGIELVNVGSPSPDSLRRLQVGSLTASGVVLIDLTSGEELYERRGNERFPMASITKIMTALLLLEHHTPQEIVTIPSLSEQVGGSTLHLRQHQRFVLGDLLKAMLIPSANDAAYALAMFHSRSIAHFVSEMNERARALGLTETHFGNPAGLDSEAQFSSPRDLAWLTAAALKHPLFRSIVSLSLTSINSMEGTTYELQNTNELLRSHENVQGVKTGTTTAAGECLIVLFTEGNRPYLLVLLGAKDRYSDARTIIQAVRSASSA